MRRARASEPAPASRSAAALNATGRSSSARASGILASGQPDIFVVEGLAVDAPVGRREPGRNLAGLGDRPHQAMDKGAVGLARQPLAAAALERLGADDPPERVGRNAGPEPDRAPKSGAGQGEARVESGCRDHAVPALEEDVALLDIGRAYGFVHGVARWDRLV